MYLYTLNFAPEMNTSGNKTPTTFIHLYSSFEFRGRFSHNTVIISQ